LVDGEEVNEDRHFKEFFGWDESKRRFQLGELRGMKLWYGGVGDSSNWQGQTDSTAPERMRPLCI